MPRNPKDGTLPDPTPAYNPHRTLIRAADLRRGDMLWFAGTVVTEITEIPGDRDEPATLRVVAVRGAHGPVLVHLWRPTIPLWVRVPRHRIDP